VTDPYRGLMAPQTPRPEPHTGAADSVVRPLLWTLLLISAVGNTVTSSVGGISIFVGLGLGVLTLACAAALVAHHRLRGRS
jgi:hypothetical protein